MKKMKEREMNGQHIGSTESTESLCDYMRRKLDEMHGAKSGTVTIDFAEFARLYQLVCYMRQIRFIANGWE